MNKDLLEMMRDKSDVYLTNIVEQKANNAEDVYNAAMLVFEERGLSIEKSNAVKEQNFQVIKQLEERIMKGAQKDELNHLLHKNGFPQSQIPQTISNTYKKLEMELDADFKGRRRYYIYVVFWVIAFSIFLLFTVEPFMGDATLMLNFLLFIPFFYLRFKPIFKLRDIRVANRDNGYEIK